MRASDARARATAITVAMLSSVVGVSAVSPRARCEAGPSPAELTAARELFERGLALEEKGDWAGALALFEKVATVKTSASVRFHLGLCLEHLGRGVDALDQFERAGEMSARAGDEDGKRLHERAVAHVAALRKSLPTVRIASPAGAKLALDDRPLSATIAAAGVRVDPGRHVVSVSADGYEPSRRELVVAAEPALSLDVTIELGAPIVRASPPMRRELRDAWVPWVSGGAAVLALGGATAFYVLRARTISDLDAACGAGRAACPESARPTYDRGRLYANVGDVLLGVGTASAAFGLGWLVFGPRAPVSASVGIGSVDVIVRF
jgi:tetratricopeptide (TPR) repeat protein